MTKVRSEFDDFLRHLGKRIQSLRQEAGITQEMMDEAPYAVSVSGLQQIEYGQVDVRLYTIWRIARKLNIPVKKIFENL